MLDNGYFLNGFTISSDKFDGFGIDAKEKTLDYSSKKIEFFGSFDTTFNGGSLYQSIMDENDKNKSSLVFTFLPTIDDDDLREVESMVKRIEKIEFLIESDKDANRYFYISMKPNMKDEINRGLIL